MLDERVDLALGPEVEVVVERLALDRPQRVRIPVELDEPRAGIDRVEVALTVQLGHRPATLAIGNEVGGPSVHHFAGVVDEPGLAEHLAARCLAILPSPSAGVVQREALVGAGRVVDRRSGLALVLGRDVDSADVAERLEVALLAASTLASALAASTALPLALLRCLTASTGVISIGGRIALLARARELDGARGEQDRDHATDSGGTDQTRFDGRHEGATMR